MGELMGTVHKEQGAGLSEKEQQQVVNLNRIRNKSLFSSIKGLGLELLSTGISKTVINRPLTIVDAPVGDLDLRDPAILLSLDIIGEGKGLLYLALNAKRDEVIAKMILALTGVNEDSVKKGALIEESSSAFTRACTFVYNSKIFVAEGSAIQKLWVDASELKKEGKIDLILIDDMHAIGFEILDDEKTTYQDLMEYLHEMAGNVGVPIVLVARSNNV
jgi:hypothetical protein